LEKYQSSSLRIGQPSKKKLLYFSLLWISPERDAVQAGPQAGGEPLPAGRPRRQSGQRGVSQALQERSRSLSINNNIRKNWVKKIPNQEQLFPYGEMGGYRLVARLLATAALWFRIQTSPNNTKWAT
jgi:hypothetical protein